MKWKLISAALLAVAIGLALYLSAKHERELSSEKSVFEARLQALSNDLRQTHEKWVDQTKVNTVLEGSLDTKSLELASTSNRVSQLSNLLSRTEAEAKVAAESARQELATRDEGIAKRDGRITELEGEKDTMTRRLGELNTEITQLETHIGETQRKLAASEGDRDFLLKELKRLQAEKAELERQFNDLAVLREQVKKLRDELSIARRIEWIRRGLYGSNTKGGERLMRGSTPERSGTNYDLNAEIHQDGSARIVPGTNQPAATPAPAPAPPGQKPPPTP